MFKTPVQYSLYIENVVGKTNLTHLEAVLEFCEDNSIDPSDIKPLISQTLKDRIRIDMQNLGMIPQNAVLEV